AVRLASRARPRNDDRCKHPLRPRAARGIAAVGHVRVRGAVGAPERFDAPAAQLDGGRGRTGHRVDAAPRALAAWGAAHRDRARSHGAHRVARELVDHRHAPVGKPRPVTLGCRGAPGLEPRLDIDPARKRHARHRLGDDGTRGGGTRVAL
ncbi:MAG: hypothetical protein AVDCRST_MAG71-1525, partial [uncultured Lysobacter sp.]